MPGATSCDSCMPGRYAPAVKSTNCTACAAGQSQTAAGQDSCDNCTSGFYSASDGEGDQSSLSMKLCFSFYSIYNTGMT